MKISKSKQIVETDAIDAPVKDINWNANQIETDTVPIVDPGTGGKIVLRWFFFKAAPIPKGFRKPTRQQILEQYKRLVDEFLWKDGLEPLSHKPAKVILRKEVKSDELKAQFFEAGADFAIAISAWPRMGQSVIDKARIA